MDCAIPGVRIVHLEALQDERGFFARTHCEDEFAAAGLVGRFRQSSISFNAVAGTVRGMHFSVGLGQETKFVRCIAGAIHDVLVDIRQQSATYLKSMSVDLSADNRRGLYVPAGIAHGFQALSDRAEVLYMIDHGFSPEAARGVRWNDPAIRVRWPLPVSVISQRDLSYPDWVP